MPKAPMGLRGILHRPLTFDWTKRNSQPQALTPKYQINKTPTPLTTQVAQSNPIEVINLAEYLHKHSISMAGATFSFVVRLNAPHLYIGVRVSIDNGLEPLERWQTPWRERKERDPINGQNIFCSPEGNREDNYFSTATDEGLGWILATADGQRPWLYLMEVQEDLYFINEIRRQRALSLAHAKKLEVLKLWKHLNVAALEDLAPRLGFQFITAISQAGQYGHLYDELFSRRWDYNDGSLYDLVDKSALPPGQYGFNSAKWWLYNFGQ